MRHGFLPNGEQAGGAMDLGLKDRAALIIGGSGGIGRAAASALAAEGARVALAGRSRDWLEEAAGEIETRTGQRPMIYTADCSHLPEATRVVHDAVGALGRLDILVNAIGAAKGGRLEDLSAEDWEWSLSSKLLGQIWCCRAALPKLREGKGGCIVNVIGHRGKQPMGGALPAGVANAGLINFTVALAQDEAPHGVRVVGINPAPVETRRLREVFETEARVHGLTVEEAGRRWLAHVPLGRAARAEEIGDVIVFLSSARASFITGTVVHVDGGATRSL